MAIELLPDKKTSINKILKKIIIALIYFSTLMFFGFYVITPRFYSSQQSPASCHEDTFIFIYIISAITFSIWIFLVDYLNINKNKIIINKNGVTSYIFLRINVKKFFLPLDKFNNARNAVSSIAIFYTWLRGDGNKTLLISYLYDKEKVNNSIEKYKKDIYN